MAAWSFSIIYYFKGGLSETGQKASNKLIPGNNAPWGIIPFRVPVTEWPTGWVDFICMNPSLVPDPPALLGEKIADEKKSYQHHESGIVPSGNRLESLIKLEELPE